MSWRSAPSANVRQNEHSRSANSVTVTGARGGPSLTPDWGIPAKSPSTAPTSLFACGLPGLGGAAPPPREIATPTATKATTIRVNPTVRRKRRSRRSLSGRPSSCPVGSELAGSLGFVGVANGAAPDDSDRAPPTAILLRTMMSPETGLANSDSVATLREPAGRLRVAVIDRDSGFVRVLANRVEAAGWEFRALPAPVTPERLVEMRLHAVVVDLALLGPDSWQYLERLSARLPTLVVVICTGQSSLAQRVRG